MGLGGYCSRTIVHGIYGTGGGERGCFYLGRPSAGL